MARFASELPAPGAITDTDLLVLEQSNAPKKLTIAALRTALGTASGFILKAGDVSIGPLAQNVSADLGYQLRQYATTPIGASIDTTTGTVGGTFFDSNSGSVGAGGATLFGAASKPYAYIKGYFVSSANNGVGDLVFGTRRASTDATMVEGFRLLQNGVLDAAVRIDAPVFRATAAAGTSAYYQSNVGGVLRWQWGRNGTAEAGADTGSNWNLARYSDAGSLLSLPIFVARDTGLTTINNGLSLASQVGSSASDLSKHIALYGSVYGFSITSGSLNVVTAGTAVINMFKGSDNIATFDSATSTVRSSLVVDCTGSTSHVFRVNEPGGSPAGSAMYFSGPGGNVGIQAQYGTTKRRDIQFSNTGIYLAVSSNTSAVTPQFGFGEGGDLTLDGNVRANGTAYFGDDREIIRYSDGWLRLNPANDFTSGIYCGTGLFRTDGTLRVGTNSTAGLEVSTSVCNYKGVELGYRSVPLTTHNASTTLVEDQRGKGLMHSTTTNHTYTVPANVFTAGDVVTAVHTTSTGTLTLGQGAGMSLFLAGSAGAAGNRTVGPRGVATIFFLSATSALVGGPAVS